MVAVSTYFIIRTHLALLQFMLYHDLEEAMADMKTILPFIMVVLVVLEQ